MKLCDLLPGQTAQVETICGKTCNCRKQLMAMGITRGAEITMKSVTSCGGPVQVMVRGTSLMLRGAEASTIEIKNS